MRWLSRTAQVKRYRPRKGKNARPTLEVLEDRRTPAVALTNLAFSPTTINEGAAGTLTGDISGYSVGSLSVKVDWGDGSAAQTVPLAVDATTISVPHTYTGLTPGVGSDNFTIKATLLDSGPSVITGPDGGGYRAYDTPFTNIDLSSTTTGIATVSFTNPNDDSVVLGTPGFVSATDTFRFYGTNYTISTALFIGTNGVLSLGGANTSPANTNLQSMAHPTIAPFWTDLALGSGSVLVNAADLDASGKNDWLVIEWKGVQSASGAGPISFEALLQLNTGATDGDVIFNYVNTNFNDPTLDNGLTATVGMADANATAGGKLSLVQMNKVTDFVHTKQAMYFSTQNLNPSTILGSGSPDGAGYAATASPFLSNFDISSSPVANLFQFIGNNQTNATAGIQFGPPDSFTFYGTSYTILGLTSNGLITFNSFVATGTNTPLASLGQPGIATLWTALTTGPNGQVLGFLENGLDGVNDQFVIFEWSKELHVAGGVNSPNGGTFEVLMELDSGVANGNVFFNYNSTNFGDAATNGATATVGITDGASNTTQVSFNTASEPSNTAIAFLDVQSSATTPVTVNVPPTAPVDNDNTANSVTEGNGGGTTVGLTAFATDGASDPVTYSLSANPNGVFAIDPNSGVVTVAPGKIADFESSGGSYSITVQATDQNGLSSSTTFTINVINLPPGPLTDVNTKANIVPEGSATGTLVGITGQALDPGGSPVTYSLLGNPGSLQVDPNTGVVSVANGNMIDWDTTGPTHTMTVTVVATDGDNTTSMATFTITIKEVPPFLKDTDPTPNQVAEGVANGTPVGVTVLGVDPGSLTTPPNYTFSDPSGIFAMDPATNQIFVQNTALLNYKTSAPSHSYTVFITASFIDGEGVSGGFTIKILNVPPTAPINVDGSGINVLETAPPGTHVGITAKSTDPFIPAGAIRYSLTNSAGGRFIINAITGVVAVSAKGIGEYDSSVPLTITVRASDGLGGFSFASFDIPVTQPANEPPESLVNHTYKVSPNNPLSVSAATGLLQGLVSDNGGPIFLVGVVSKPPGTLTINFSTGAFMYTAPPGTKNTTYTLVYRVRDSFGVFGNITATLVIGPAGKLDGF
jgi:hypothetical protein